MRKKIALHVLASNLDLAIHFVLILVLSRLLTPEDVGVFSMSAVLIAVAHVFRDFGVTAFIRQLKQLDNETLRTARTLLMITSSVVAGFMYLSAPLWARFFGEPKVQEVVTVLALGFLFIPLGAVPHAILSRNAQVERSALALLGATSIYFVVSVAFALNGFKHMTMAWANLVNIITHGLLLNVLLGRRLPWRPSLQGWHTTMKFGLGNMATNLTSALNNALPDVVLGRLSTAATVGLYSRANGTVTMVEKILQPPVSYFTLPQMARLHHAAGDVSGSYLQLTSIVQSLMFPALVWIAIVAHDLVQVFYGAQWLGAAPAIPWLCIATGIAVSFALAMPTLTSVGKSYAPLAPLLLMVAGKLVAITLLFDGTLPSFAKALALGEALSVPAYLWILQRSIGVIWWSWFWRTFKQALWLAPVNVAVLIVSTTMLNTAPIWLHLLATGVLSAALHLILYWYSPLPISAELRILIKNLRPRAS